MPLEPVNPVSRALCRVLQWATQRRAVGAACWLVIATTLTGCGGVGDQVPTDPTSAVVVVGVLDSETEDFIEVEATAVVGGVRGTVTVEEGSVVLRGIPFGTGTPPTQPLTVTARGYVTAAYLVQISVTTATFETVVLEPANLETTGIIEGHLTESTTGDPITSALVTFQYEQLGTEEPVVVSAYTDLGGYYIIGGVPIGRVDVTAAATGYLGSTAVFNVAQAAGSATAQTLDFQLVPGETRVPVSGRVVDVTTQAPITGAEVTIGEFAPVISGGTGAFTVPDVLVGEQALVVKADGYDDYRETITVLPGMSLLQVQMNTAAPDPPPPPYTITGTVTLVGAEDNSGAQVEAFDVYNAVVAARTTTNAAGQYWLFVPASRYTITVSYGGRSISRTLDLPGGGQKLQEIDFTLTVE